jgi:hypothetical protein
MVFIMFKNKIKTTYSALLLVQNVDISIKF